MPSYDGTIFDQGGQVFNVKSSAYGALGNGSTDDRTAIQSAINAAAAAGGGIVYFPAGIYIISGKLTLASFVKLVGESSINYYGGEATSFERNGTSIIRQAQSTVGMQELIYIADVQACVIQGLSIEGAVSTTANPPTQIGSANGITVINSQAVHITDCKIYGAGNRGLDANAMKSHSQIDKCVFMYNKNGGIRFTASHDSLITDTYVINNREGLRPGVAGSGNSHGIELYASRTNRILGCKVEWSDGCGIYLHGVTPLLWTVEYWTHAAVV